MHIETKQKGLHTFIYILNQQDKNQYRAILPSILPLYYHIYYHIPYSRWCTIVPYFTLILWVKKRINIQIQHPVCGRMTRPSASCLPRLVTLRVMCFCNSGSNEAPFPAQMIEWPHRADFDHAPSLKSC